jgi:hypothetical protein
VNATAADMVVPSTETYGLPPNVPHLIAKLRLVDPDVLAQITHKTPEATA